MENFKDYTVLIEDMEDLETSEKEITKFELIQIINKRLGKKWTSEDWSKGIDIEVLPEWKKLLQEDGSILWEYTKLGWKAMQYQQRDQKGNIKREWLSFKSSNYKGKNK